MPPLRFLRCRRDVLVLQETPASLRRDAAMLCGITPHINHCAAVNWGLIQRDVVPQGSYNEKHWTLWIVLDARHFPLGTVENYCFFLIMVNDASNKSTRWRGRGSQKTGVERRNLLSSADFHLFPLLQLVLYSWPVTDSKRECIGLPAPSGTARTLVVLSSMTLRLRRIFQDPLCFSNAKFEAFSRVGI